MKSFQLKTNYKQLLADTVTPVSIYLKLRDKFIKSLLLESSDYQGNENSFSYICCQPIASFKAQKGDVHIVYPDGSEEHKKIEKKNDVVQLLSDFTKSFSTIDNHDFKFINNGIFGYMAYDAVQYFEDIDFSDNVNHPYHIPEIFYQVFKYVIAIDHYKNALYIFEHLSDHEEPSSINHITTIINNKNFPAYNFSSNGKETSNYTDEEFLDLVNKGKQHCFRGDVFQIVLSRRFEASFKGDDFNVYRALRSINPSPYLFYFDYGDFKIFGSSPEAQIVIKDKKASIYPIAGTFRRTGNDRADALLAEKLHEDVKETSEHVMLVDLARNDLSRNGEQVVVENFKEIQYFSHVIHLVSKVTGQLTDAVSPIQLVGDTFPAGTLSGAPKHMAMNLINKYENSRRGYYGGAIGFLGFNGDFNHAIMIRSFLSKDNTMYFQAGAGIVAKSDSASELQEVNNKLAALRQAIQMAAEIN